MNNISLVERHNSLFEKIHKATTVEELRDLLSSLKDFVTMHKDIDSTSVKRLYEKYSKKLQTLLEENNVEYERLSVKAEKIRNRTYDFANEKDDTLAVQNNVLHLMAQLPKAKTSANAGMITNTLANAITSGVVGCKAILELLRYPVYADMVCERQRQEAFDGSKSKQEQLFDKQKELDLRNTEKAMANVYLKGYHLRTIEKQTINLSKSI